jgi:hypothetical protein
MNFCFGNLNSLKEENEKKSIEKKTRMRMKNGNFDPDSMTIYDYYSNIKEQTF